MVCTNVEEIEPRACLVGLYIAVSPHKPVILETNCLFTKIYLSNNVLYNSALVDLKREALGVPQLIPQCNMAWITRDKNKVGH